MNSTPNYLMASYLFFLVWLIVLTVLLGIVGAFFSQIVSYIILFPFIIAFFLMAQRFVKTYQFAPDSKQRWQLSSGCTSIFWLYSVVAGVIGLMLVQGKIDFAPLMYALHNSTFVIFFIGIFLCVNALLVGLGFWFLGKPTQKMLKHHHPN